MERPSAPKALGGEVLPPGAQPLAADDPAVIDGHRLTGILSSGGTTVVYLARDADGEHVVVKTTRARKADQTQARRRLRTEASCARRLPPFCTARLLTDGTEHSPPYLISEYIEGPSLAQFVEGLGPLEPDQLRALGIALARALGAVHGAGLVHCDLQPTNIMLASNGPRVIDFSVAREAPLAGKPAEVGTVPHSPGWVAPERTNGFPATPSSDVFGWGCVIGYAATGRSPFEDGDGTGSPARAAVLEALEEPLRSLVEAALALDPVDRPSAGEIASRLSPAGQRQVHPAPQGQDAPERRSISPVDAPTTPIPAFTEDNDPRTQSAAPAFTEDNDPRTRGAAPASSPFEPVTRPDVHARRPEPPAGPGEIIPWSRPQPAPVADRRPRDVEYAAEYAQEGATAAYPPHASAAPYPPNAATGEYNRPPVSHARPPTPRTDPPPRRVDYADAAPARPHAARNTAPERRPRKMRAVAMVAGPAVAVAVIATVIAMASTGAGRQEQQANPAGAASPGDQAPPADPQVPPVSGPRSQGPHHRSASRSPGASGTPTPGAGRPSHRKNPVAPGGPGHSKPPVSHPSTPPPSHTPTPSPTPTPTGTGAPQGG